MKLSQLISDLGHLSADENHITWSEEKKTVAINLALAAISSIRPDENVQTVDFELSAGSEQTLPAGTTNIVGEIRNICIKADGSEEVQTPVSQSNESEQLAFKYYKSTTCSTSEFPSDNTCSKWVLKSWSYDSRSPQRLVVDPPIPPGVKPKIKLTIVGCPKKLTWPADKDVDVGCRHIAALIEYSLFVLYDIEIESEMSHVRSQKHYAAFRSLMGDEYRADQRYGSGFWKGQIGKGDPRVV